MAILDSVDWRYVRSHYDSRMTIHGELLDLQSRNSVVAFADLALGISNNDGNYSAVEHGLGPKIMATNSNAPRQVFNLAESFGALKSARNVPELIKLARLRYLQIGVGSEISCMVNPTVCWVANSRTIWTHLVIKHADNVARANEELGLYRSADVEGEMAYQMWSSIHAELNVALTRVAELGSVRAKECGIEPGTVVFLWADAIASYLYEKNKN